MRILRNLIIFLVLALLPAICGCGYRLTSHQDLSSPLAGRKIAVPVFVNKSYRANLGAFMTESLVEQFARRTGGNVVSEEAADLVLTGTVVSYVSNPVSYTAPDTAKEYRAVVTVEGTLAERNTMKVLWKGTISWGQDYPVNTVVALQQNNEEAAIRAACAKLAQIMYERVSAGF